MKTTEERKKAKEFKNLSNSIRFIRANPKLSGYTVATLPTGSIGDVAYVTDATTPTYLAALTGGAAVICPVFHNGTIWISY